MYPHLETGFEEGQLAGKLGCTVSGAGKRIIFELY